MARSLNGSRIMASWVIAAVTLVYMLLTKPAFTSGGIVYWVFLALGLFFIAVCSLGRMYVSAFLGGYKNAVLITQGPFSAVRNPLYFFSLLGFLGLSLVTMRPLLFVLVPLAFVALYHFLIKREEAFLTELFGDKYKEYIKRVPRLIPNIKLFSVPEVVEVRTHFLKNAALDSIWWFAGFYLLEALNRLL